jgi:hypothetical protein
MKVVMIKNRIPNSYGGNLKRPLHDQSNDGMTQKNKLSHVCSN